MKAEVFSHFSSGKIKMTKEKILIVDDEEDILELLKFNLTREGYEVVCAGTGEKVLKIIESVNPDLIVLDLMLPGTDGLEVTKKLKNNPKNQDIPIIMLTAKGEESDIVIGLELGADDYITKPFSPKILIARIRAVIRRKINKPAGDASEIRIHDLVIHTGMRTVLIKGKPVELTFTEFQILSFLARRPGWVFTRSQIIDKVRGDNYPCTDRIIDVQIAGLRKKLGYCGIYIETVRGVGYRFRENP